MFQDMKNKIVVVPCIRINIPIGYMYLVNISFVTKST